MFTFFIYLFTSLFLLLSLFFIFSSLSILLNALTIPLLYANRYNYALLYKSYDQIITNIHYSYSIQYLYNNYIPSIEINFPFLITDFFYIKLLIYILLLYFLPICIMLYFIRNIRYYFQFEKLVSKFNLVLFLILYYFLLSINLIFLAPYLFLTSFFLYKIEHFIEYDINLDLKDYINCLFLFLFLSMLILFLRYVFQFKIIDTHIYILFILFILFFSSNVIINILLFLSISLIIFVYKYIYSVVLFWISIKTHHRIIKRYR